MAYDGSLIFDTHIDTNGFENGIAQLHSIANAGGALDALKSSLEGISIASTNAFQSIMQLTQINTAQITPFGTGGALSAVSELKTVMLNSVNSAVQAFVQAANSQQFNSAGKAMMLNTAKGVQSDAALKSSIISAVQSAHSSAQSKSAQFFSVGVYMAQGIESGINAGASGIVNAMVSAVNSAISAAKTAAQIKSPSRVFNLQVGRMFMQGIEQGIEFGTSGASKQIEDAVHSILKTAQAANGKFAKNALNLNALGAQNAYNFSAAQAQILQKAASAQGNATLALAPVYSGNVQSAQSQKGDMNLYMTVNSTSALSESEITRQAQDFLTKAKRKLP